MIDFDMPDLPDELNPEGLDLEALAQAAGVEAAPKFDESDWERTMTDNAFRDYFGKLRFSKGWKIGARAYRYEGRLIVLTAMIDERRTDGDPKKVFQIPVVMKKMALKVDPALLDRLLLMHLERAKKDGLSDAWRDGVNLLTHIKVA